MGKGGGSDEEKEKKSDEDEENKAAAKIQALHRGKKGRRKAKAVEEQKEKDEHRKKHNPKIGEATAGEEDGEESGLLGKGIGKANETAAAAAAGSTEMMLKMFGKDGGAYMRTGDQRQCRDLPMCVSFGIYWICMLYLANYGWTNGDVNSLFFPVNYEGRACGVGDLENYKSLYYPWVMIPEMNTCVDECPTKESHYAVNGKVPPLDDVSAPFSSFVCNQEAEVAGRFAVGSYADPSDNYKKEVCGESCITVPGMEPQCIPKECIGGKGMVEAGPCWHPYGETKNVLYQCIPIELAKNVSALLLEEVAGQVGSQHFNDMKEFAWVIGACCGISLVISFAWIVFLDMFAGPLIWCTVYTIVFVLPCIALTAFYQAGVVTVPNVPPEVQARMADVKTSAATAQLIGICCLIADGVLVAIFCIFKERITISIGVIEEAGDCFLDVPTAIFVPIFTFAFQLPVCIWGVVSSLLIASLREFDHHNQVWVYSDELKTMAAFNGVGILWLIYTIASIQYTTIAGACATWYFTFPEKDNPHERHLPAFTILRSCLRLFRYNLGSMIFGGLLITIVMIGKWVATYFINQVMAQSPENPMIKFLGACLLCVVHCIEKFVRFLGKLAYIEVAIYGHNFCTGIYCAAKRLIKNILRFSFLAIFAHLMIFMGKIATVAGSTYICFVMMSLTRDPANDFAVPVAPLLFCAIVAALVVTLIMSVYEVAIDTIMMCFLEDEAENTGDKPSFASGVLAQFMTSTKSISDAAEAYGDSVRGAKTDRIREEGKCTEELKETHAGVKAASEGKKGGGNAKKRRAAKKAEQSEDTTENPAAT